MTITNKKTSEYPAKKAYQTDKVMFYDEQRFKSIKGRLFDWLEKRSVMVLLKKYSQTGDNVLDIPIGTGRIAEVLLQNKYKVTGADISDEMLELAKKKLKIFGDNVSFKREDAENMSFNMNTFDFSTSVRLFGHLPESVKETVLKEMLRVSEKGCVVQFYYDSSFHKFKRYVKKMLTKNKAPWFPMKRKEIAKLVQRSGGTIVEQKRVLPILSEGISMYIKRIAD